jgi:uncharacterized glyoxalase superfamily protein PhnB
MSANSGDVPFVPAREEPATFRARAATVSLTVKDLQKSIAWYRDVAAFMIDEEWQRDGKIVGVSFKAGEVELWLAQDDGAKGWDRQKGEGFSVQFTTAQDVDKLAKGMKARGGVLESEPTDMPWGARVFRVKDPDGYKLAFSQEKE